MLEEVLSHLAPKEGEVACDCTLGGAGHSVELAKRLGSQGLLIGIDQDEMALAAAGSRLEAEVPDVPRKLLRGNFGDLDELLVEAEVPGVDCFLFDLGVSSPQLDVADRGFSYRLDARLDMRMNRDADLSAYEVVNGYSVSELTRILSVYGEERHAGRIARAIAEARKASAITTTSELANICAEALPAKARRASRHPARKCFQAIRIEVNHEMEVLERGLEAAIRWAEPQARICVIAYHSLEDRIVKHTFSEMAKGCVCPPDLPVCVCGHVPIVEVKTRRPLVASEDEVAANPRARSALMRVATKLDTSDA